MQEMMQVYPGRLDPSCIRDFLVSIHEEYWPSAAYEFDLDAYPRKLAACAEGFAEVSKAGVLEAVVLGYANDSENHVAYISYIARRSDARSSGRCLHQAFVEFAREHGMQSIRLEVLRGNLCARAFYDRVGYRLAEDRGDRLLLEKAI